LFALIAWLTLGGPTASHAEPGDLVTARRTLGLAFLGGSAAMAWKGLDFHSEADDFYQGYRTAVDPVEIDKLYQRTTNRDVKAQVSWAMAAAFGISGLRLILVGDGGSAGTPPTSSLDDDDGASPAAGREAVTPSPTQLVLQPAIAEGKVELELHHRFY